ncbi:hypothetical protein C9F11_22160 [Streptomyces sp. YIM 121038]|uniref:HAAS signaling domain-containing protein n=1 Tax=Streptomyces sp. YIM 121038 TaxID=2136401 RepID=UPI0011107BF2|nr:hypothetical protein [Streptomyces sp. YIM 121038]QCX78059.1 hypothetical protein C9F11_22160 [Streptomyces sp. YIM 121038]
MNALDHALVRAYLTEVERATSALEPARRQELLADLREHVESRIADAGAPDDATVRGMLADLGTPAAIAASALAESAPAPAPAAAPAAAGATADSGSDAVRTKLTILLLLCAAPLGLLWHPFATVVAGGAGLYLLSKSTRWTTRQKVTGTALTLLVPLLPVLVGLLLAAGRIGPMELLLLMFFSLVLPVLGARLLWRAARGARAAAGA